MVETYERKKMRFSICDDLVLLNEIVTLNPFEQCSRWADVRSNVCFLTGKPFSLRSCREHTDGLIRLFQKEDTYNLRKSSTEEQFDLKMKLIQKVYDLREKFMSKKVGKPGLSSHIIRFTTDEQETESWSSDTATKAFENETTSALDLDDSQSVADMEVISLDGKCNSTNGPLENMCLSSGSPANTFSLTENTSVEFVEVEGEPESTKKPEKETGSRRSTSGFSFLEKRTEQDTGMRKQDRSLEEEKIRLEEQRFVQQQAFQERKKILEERKREQGQLLAEQKNLLEEKKLELELKKQEHALEERKLALDEKALALEERKLQFEEEKFQFEKEEKRRRLEMEIDERRHRLQQQTAQSTLLHLLAKTLCDRQLNNK